MAKRRKKTRAARPKTGEMPTMPSYAAILAPMLAAVAFALLHAATMR